MRARRENQSLDREKARRLIALSKHIKRSASNIEKKLREAGARPTAADILTVTQYWKTLEWLK